MKNIKQEYLDLVKKIIEYDKQYYEGNSIISDKEYDILYRKLKNIEEKYPDIIVNFSPTQSIEHQIIINNKDLIHHKYKMLSIENAFTLEELSKFFKRIHKDFPNAKISSEYKLDGVAFVASYSLGKLISIATRGNGVLGDDITALKDVIKGIPKTINNNLELEFYGEIIISKEDFKELNFIRKKHGLESWANPRNLVAGSIRLKNIDEVQKRMLQVIFYGIKNDSNIKNQKDVVNYFGENQMPVNKIIGIHTTLSSAEEAILYAQNLRSDLPFEIDGIVFKVFDLSERDFFGVSSKFCKGMIAYKISQDSCITKINDITYQVGRTGTITPVAILEPVNIFGVTISRATLHNFSEIIKKDIRIGDFVFVERSGDVIPYVIGVDFSKRHGDVKSIALITQCPSCSSNVFYSKDYKHAKCSNLENCQSVKSNKIKMFTSKQCADIRYLGDKIVDMLIQHKLLNSIEDIYKLKKEDFNNLHGIGEKITNSILNSINDSKKISVDRILAGIGIPGTGIETIKKLLYKFESISRLMNAELEEIEKIHGLGDKLSKNIYDFFRKKENISLINFLNENNVIDIYKTHKADTKKTLVFTITGKVNDVSRSDIQNIIESRGHIFVANPTKQCNYIIVGENAGSKLQKAIEYNIPAISFEDFMKQNY